jgi:hypothetical protein
VIARHVVERCIRREHLDAIVQAASTIARRVEQAPDQDGGLIPSQRFPTEERAIRERGLDSGVRERFDRSVPPIAGGIGDLALHHDPDGDEQQRHEQRESTHDGTPSG